MTETCDDETPHVITHVETTPATTYDGAVMETIHASLAAKGLLPEEHVVDSGYLDADILASSLEKHTVTLVGPVLLDTSWQAKAEQGFAITNFTIDWPQQQVVCPAGKTSRLWIKTYNRHGYIEANLFIDRLTSLLKRGALLLLPLFKQIAQDTIMHFQCRVGERRCQFH